MTNIFDGYENKSAEELAAELGISESSVVKKAGKKTLDNLIETNHLDISKNEKIIANENVNNLNLWTDNFSLMTLEPGIRFKEIQSKIIWKITDIQLCVEEGLGDIWAQKTTGDNPYNPIFHYEDFKKKCVIFKEDLVKIAKKYDFLDEKYVNHPDARLYWMKNYEFSDLVEGSRVRTMDPENKKCGVITSKQMGIIRVEYSDGSIYNKKYSLFLEDHKLFKQDFVSECYNRDFEIRNDVEARKEFKLRNLEKGISLVDTSDNTWYYIIDIREQKANPNNEDDEDCTIIELWNLSDDYRTCKFDKSFVNKYNLYDYREMK